MIVKEPLAKKIHKCDLCNGQIQIWKKYKKITVEKKDWLDWVDNGKSPFQTFHRHFDCDDAWIALIAWYNDSESLAYFYLEGTADAAYEQLHEDFRFDMDFKKLMDEVGIEKYVKVKVLLDTMGIRLPEHLP